ncbi:MAG: ATP-binding protein [Bdellovibrionales bacterium]|jgi:predicted AAA+ superfamily ATPase|nr:ATP-binding protein [Bdellovibrionales bacterium]
MANVTRYLHSQIQTDALDQGKIAFINGPRQVGKTTLAEAVLSDLGQEEHYYTWDDDEFRRVWAKGLKDFFNQFKHGSTLVLDEIHKDRKWKTKLKGAYDLHKKDIRFMVTGSARLDFYRRFGDSLQGRYLPYRMHPLSVGEETFVKPPPENEWDEIFSNQFSWEDLLQYSGFPEPFFLQNKQKARRWQRLYRERLMQQDLRDLEGIRDVRQVESLGLLLQERVGSQLSYEALRQDLSVSFDSVKRWIELLEALYFCYRIRPYSKGVKNSLRKEPKLFLYDWSLGITDGGKFENLIAGHLLKSCHAWTDCGFGEFDLNYVRDKQKREVDFLVVRDGEPFALIEVKSGQAQPTPALLHFQKMLQPKFCLQVVKNQRNEKRKSSLHPGVRIISVEKFLGGLV